MKEIQVKDNVGIRIDKFLSINTELSRSKIQKLIKEKKILIQKL